MKEKLNPDIIKNILLTAIPFFLMDIIVRAIGKSIVIEVGNSVTNFYPIYSFAPNLFTIIWIFFFISIIINIGKKGGKTAYFIFFALSYIFFVTNIIYYKLTSFYFSFSLMKMASEGSSYILDVIISTPVYLYLIMLLVLIIGIFCGARFKGSEKTNIKKLVICLIVFLALHALAPLSLGKAYDHLKWKSFKNGRNVYNEFSDINKSMKVAGLYEFTVRNFYVSFLKPEEKMSEDDEKFLKEAYGDSKTAAQNDYTGIFKGKNVIFLQLEGLDNWLLTEETTPNLYKLQKESLNFTDHYSIYTGGGSTFNSEFAVNTGFTTPVSYEQNVYTLNKNDFPASMAKLFKNENYHVNAFHMNSGEFYNRSINYKNWGYDNYYSLIDSGEYKNQEYDLDRELILNKTFYEKLFKQEGSFLDYIITYTPHTPFTTSKGVGKMVGDLKYGEGNIPEDLSEEDIVRLEAGETDYMVGLLIQALKDNDLYDNTVIVAFADHYLYTINDKTVLDKYKTTSNNLINNTPFFIWSSGIESQNIDKTTMQMNILPTVLNLFGIEYSPSSYLCGDALAPDYKGLAFFADSSWYNGDTYVENAVITQGSELPKEEIESISDYVSELIRKNDLTLKYNYFKRQTK
ncbi:MAG: LTA synthase family protein [Lachnospiraceae bacterium]|nr:LTA synthase family protein [Lachnospiraceae bacterium]